ncbi:hypothetical protein P3W85_36220, partial [Cupriavidus basilensis]|nr:hypothetical protein [Cupriavidus basilensis]
MTKTFARKLVSTLVLSFAAIGAAHAASAATARDLLPGDKYGYEFRTHDTFTDGARSGKLDVFT